MYNPFFRVLKTLGYFLTVCSVLNLFFLYNGRPRGRFWFLEILFRSLSFHASSDPLTLCTTYLHLRFITAICTTHKHFRFITSALTSREFIPQMISFSVPNTRHTPSFFFVHFFFTLYLTSYLSTSQRYENTLIKF